MSQTQKNHYNIICTLAPGWFLWNWIYVLRQQSNLYSYWQNVHKRLDSVGSTTAQLVTADLSAPSITLPVAAAKGDHVIQWAELYFRLMRNTLMQAILVMGLLLLAVNNFAIEGIQATHLLLLSDAVTRSLANTYASIASSRERIIKENELVTLLVRDQKEFEQDRADADSAYPTLCCVGKLVCGTDPFTCTLSVRTHSRMILLDNAVLRAGHSVLLRGVSGCGKTHYMRKLLGFPTPLAQDVLFDVRRIEPLDCNCGCAEAQAKHTNMYPQSENMGPLLRNRVAKQMLIMRSGPVAELPSQGILTVTHVPLSSRVVMLSQGLAHKFDMQLEMCLQWYQMRDKTSTGKGPNNGSYPANWVRG